MTTGDVRQVMLLPGAVLPVQVAYAELLVELGAGVEARLKELELYAEGGPPTAWRLDREVDGVLAAADAAGFERFHFVGYSAGAASGLLLAARHSERVLSLALLEAAWAGNRGRSPEEVRLWRRFDEMMLLPPPQLMAEFVRGQLHPGVVPPPPREGPAPPWMATRPAGLTALSRAFSEHDFDIQELRGFKRPVYYARARSATRITTRARSTGSPRSSTTSRWTSTKSVTTSTHRTARSRRGLPGRSGRCGAARRGDIRKRTSSPSGVIARGPWSVPFRPTACSGGRRARSSSRGRAAGRDAAAVSSALRPSRCSPGAWHLEGGAQGCGGVRARRAQGPAVPDHGGRAGACGGPAGDRDGGRRVMRGSLAAGPGSVRAAYRGWPDWPDCSAGLRPGRDRATARSRATGALRERAPVSTGASRLRSRTTTVGIGPGSDRDRAKLGSGQRDSSRRHVVRPWRTLTPAERAAVEDRWDDLLDAACEARRTGWERWERDPVVALVRDLGLSIWPAALDRLAAEASERVAGR